MLEAHLGGHQNKTHLDNGALDWLIKQCNAKSFLDIGCGPGGMVYEVIRLGLDARGVDGDFVTTRKKPELFEIHDFTKGKLEHINMNFDLIWCCEFIEHVEKQYEDNWINLMLYFPLGTWFYLFYYIKKNKKL